MVGSDQTMVRETVLQVELDGLNYTLRGTGGEEMLKQAATMVEQKIAVVREMSPQYSTTRTAMLAALQIAEEMLALQQEYAEMLEAADI
jgi:cell division protein ZapA